MLSKHDEVTDAEAQTVLDRGYMRVVGQLLWAARGVYPEYQQGCNQLGALHVLARPSESAWKAAMHMVSWMYRNIAWGIKFDERFMGDPVVFRDASNKPDVNDGLCRYGYMVQMAAGPVAVTSKTLAHVGLSSFHNEHMAL